MVKAISTIVVGDKIFLPGQVVTGLSLVDKKWMQESGYITDIKEQEKARRKEKKNDL